MTEQPLDRPTTDASSNADSTPWANILDIGSAVGLVAGSAASFVSQNVALAALPISLAVALHIANRRRLATEVLQDREVSRSVAVQLADRIQQDRTLTVEQLQQLHQDTSQQLTQQAQDRQTAVDRLSEYIDQLRESIAGLTQDTRQNLDGLTQMLEEQHQKLTDAIAELRRIDNASQKLQSNPNDAEGFYVRGYSHQQLGDVAEAIADYTAALDRNLGHARAYHQRGLLYAQVGNRKQAVEDLRLAAKYYFEQNDLDNYEITRDLSKQYHDLRHAELEAVPMGAVQDSAEDGVAPGSVPITPTQAEVSVGGLFS